VLTQAVTDEAIRFFNFNFPQNLYGTQNFTPAVSRPESGTIRVAASTRIPTSIMSMFGFGTLPLDVNCDASLNFVNTDVMMVLDVTGSMFCMPEESGSCGRTSEVSGSRIVALRDAVMALYDELAPIQTQLEANGMRLRYGVVPYSSAVNVGRLIRDVNPSYLRDSTPYQSRTPLYVQSTSVQTFSNQSNGQCNNRAASLSGTNINLPATDKVVSYNSSTRVCTVTTRTLNRQVTSTFANAWLFEQRTFDTSSFKNFANNVQNPARTPGTSSLSPVWNGCIEERDTVSTITGSSGYSIPSGAHDLNINLIPHNDATRWRPMWPEVVYRRAGGSTNSATGTAITSNGAPYYACPAESRRLAAWSRNQMQSYVNGLTPVGGTYHDIGMLWGARMLSASGIFGDSPTTHNGMPVAKHIIYMTDGELSPNCNTYTSYAIEQNDMRVTGGGACPQQTDRHMQRFKMICNAAKAMDASIWVIAFGSTLESHLVECASNPNQASRSANRDELIERFRQIGSQIGALRLTQ
jgi:hypothetical protein